ncbi:MAG: N-acetyltransferase [Cyclobacteriaceae bacterium]
MNNFSIALGTDIEKTWAAELMASSEPWTTLHITLDQCLSACSDKGNKVYIAQSNDNPCGVLVMQDRGVAGSPYIKSVAIAPNFRSNGIGKLLLDFAENLYRPTSKHIFLCVSSFNQQAQKFYLTNGYEMVGEFKDYIMDGYSELLMHKRLR